MKNTVLGFFAVAFFGLTACEQAKTADVDLDGTPDILIKNGKMKDNNKLDNIFVYDDVVVNGVTNQQWFVKDEKLEVVEQPKFKLKYDSAAKKWNKINLK